MKAHELAKELLGGPDNEVVISDENDCKEVGFTVLQVRDTTTLRLGVPYLIIDTEAEHYD